MNKTLPSLMALLLLCGCSQAAQPSPSPTPEPLPEFSEPTGIYADWSKLNGYKIPEQRGSRLSEEPLLELTPSDSYGKLVPYIGDVLFTDSESYVAQYYKYGLMTEDGCVVLDPVLDNVYAVYGYGGPGYVLTRGESDGTISYALCARDGSWCTDFLYNSITINDDGYACLTDIRWGETGLISDGDENACMMDLDGNVVRRFTDIVPGEGVELAAPLEQYWMYSLSSGYSMVELANGNMALMDIDGNILRSDEFGGESTMGFNFHNGLAWVRDPETQLFGVIDKSGHWACPPKYSELYGGSTLYTGITTDGRAVVLDERGNELGEADLSGNYMKLARGYYSIHYINGDTEVRGTGGDTLPSEEYPYSNGGGWVLLYGDNSYWLYDGAELKKLDLPHNSVQNMTDEGIVVSEGGKGYLCDFDGNVILEGGKGDWAYISYDGVSGEAYLVTSDYNNSYTVTSLDGERSITVPSMTIGIIGGTVCWADNVSAGVTDMDGEIIFRIPLDLGD